MDEGLKDYKLQQKSIKNFFPRFPSRPNFEGKSILEFGCGRGAFAFDLLKYNPKTIIGIDTNDEYIKFAKKSLKSNFSQYINKIDFISEDINNWKTDLKFDFVITKEAFEHTNNLNVVLDSMYNLLNKNGSVYAGFGPLYNFFNGDHGFSKTWPWFHIIMPQKFLINRINKNRDEKISTINQLGLNMYSLKKYKEIFQESKFEVEFFKTNCTSNKLALPFKILSKIKFLEEFFTFNIFTVLKKN